MDVYLSSDATCSLKGLFFLFSHSDGILIGHKRGQRFYVEKIFPTGEDFSLTVDKYSELSHIFENRIIGFFSFSSTGTKIKKILEPFAFGKLFLEICSDKENKLRIKPFTVEYKNDFFLSKIKLSKSVKE
jgi:hypothetical protein